MSDEEREYLNEMIRSLNNRLVDALRERDVARKEVCPRCCDTLGNVFCTKPIDPQGYAEQRGWDCFKEDRK